MVRKFCFYLSALLCLIFAGCSIAPNELRIAEQLIETNPDSALHILHRISAARYQSGKNRALYGLLMIEALDAKKLPLKPDTLLNYSIDYYQKHTDKSYLAACYLYRGRMMKYENRYENAMTWYLKALDVLGDENNGLLLARINLDMGDICNVQNDFVLARQKYEKAFRYFTQVNYKSRAFYALFSIGRTYYAEKDYKRTAIYYRRIAKLASDSIQWGILYQGMAINFYDDKKPDSALFYLRMAINYPYISNNRAIRYYYLASTYFDLNRNDSALYYAKRSFDFAPDIRTQRECYRIMTNCECFAGHLTEMSEYMTRYVHLGDSIRKIDAQPKGSYIESVHTAQIDAAKSKNMVLYLVVLVIVILFGTYYTYLLIIRRNIKEKQKIQEIHTEEKTELHKRIIVDMRIILQKQLEEQKKIVLAKYKNEGSREREQQLLKIYEDILHFRNPGLFFCEMDKQLNGLVTKLRNRCNTLTEKELMLCCYLLLHIPTYDMLLLFGYKSDDSLKSLKRRLTPKLNLQNVTFLEDFLLGLISEN